MTRYDFRADTQQSLKYGCSHRYRFLNLVMIAMISGCGGGGDGGDVSANGEAKDETPPHHKL